MVRAIVVGIAKLEKDSNYGLIKQGRCVQRTRALEFLNALEGATILLTGNNLRKQLKNANIKVPFSSSTKRLQHKKMSSLHFNIRTVVYHNLV